jgi:hypothetical protein
MNAGTLGEDEDQRDDRDCEDRRRDRAAEVEAALAQRLVEEIPDGRA